MKNFEVFLICGGQSNTKKLSQKNNLERLNCFQEIDEHNKSDNI